jgi:hypothetical protein
MNALRLQKDNTKLAGLLEEALDCIDQYDYEEAFDLVQRIKDALNHSRMSHPPVVPWGGSSLTEMEELLQKTQQLQRDNAELREVLARAEVLAEYTHFDGRREWRVIECWMYPNDIIVQMDRAAFNAARKEVKP